MNEQAGEIKKPGMVQAIAIMNLVDGILNCLWGLGLFFTIIGIPVGIYSIILGILELINSSKLLPDPIKLDKPPKYIAVMQIINIVSSNVIALVVGILSLVFYNDNNVKAYFQSRKGTV